MNSINRKFGKLMSKGPADSGKVSVLLSDYDDADTTLGKVDAALRHLWHLLMTINR
jgi:amphiphysin